MQPDFTKVIGKVTKDDESGTEKYEFQDVCGFRVAAVSRVPGSILGQPSTGTENRLLPAHSKEKLVIAGA